MQPKQANNAVAIHPFFRLRPELLASTAMIPMIPRHMLPK